MTTEVPPDHEVIASYGSRGDARRALAHLEDHGLGGDVALVEPDIPRMRRALQRAGAAAVAGLVIGALLGGLWPGSEGLDVGRMIPFGLVGAVAGAIVGALTPGRRSEAASEIHLAVRQRWVDDARRMLRDAGL